jgi:hypothetical protein
VTEALAPAFPPSRPFLALDYVLTLRDLREPGVDFTERIPINSRQFLESETAAAVARMRLATKAGQLRADTGYAYDAEDVRRFAAEILSVDRSTDSQSLAHSGLGLTFVATLQRAVDHG